ncbi:MAG TPA: hypothetical protein PL011_10860, partial [Kiritimatiellia bacterium]|nr:hypothetical protein [Kiritimatiellia bacterium]
LIPRLHATGGLWMDDCPAPRFSGFSTPWKTFPRFFHAMENTRFVKRRCGSVVVALAERGPCPTLSAVLSAEA